jgi:hypothetical protein
MGAILSVHVRIPHTTQTSSDRETARHNLFLWRCRFSSGPQALQYSFELQRTIGVRNLSDIVVGPWSSNKPDGPARRVLPRFIDYSRTRYDCSLNWPLTNRLYHFIDNYYIRMRQDSTMSGGNLITTGWSVFACLSAVCCLLPGAWCLVPANWALGIGWACPISWMRA